MDDSLKQNLAQARTKLAPLTNFGSGLFSIREAAVMTKTGEETIRRAIRAGMIPAYGSRGRLRIRLSDVLPVYVPQRKATHDERA
jgi:excisionase family DNA binding protein